MFTNNQTVDVGTGGAFQVPPLVGVSARAPFLHDACGVTLLDPIRGCGHGDKVTLSAAEDADLAAYLGSL